MAVVSKKDELEAFDEDLPELDANGQSLRAAVAAHLAGFGYDIIAERYGYADPKSAQIAVEGLLGRTFTASDLPAARNKSRARKERLLQSVWYDATHPFIVDEKGNQTEQRNEAHLASLDRAIRIAESIDRLDGLNAPTQVEIYRPGAEEFLTTVSELREALMAGGPREADIFDADIVDDEEEDDDGRPVPF